MKMALPLLAASTLLASSVEIAKSCETSLVHYELTAKIAGGNLVLTHLFINRSARSICLYPDTIDVARASLTTGSNKEIENISNMGTITSEQTIYIVRPDGLPHAFMSSEKISSLIRSSADADRVSRVSFQIFGYDCVDVVTKKLELIPAKVHQTISVEIER